MAVMQDYKSKQDFRENFTPERPIKGRYILAGVVSALALVTAYNNTYFLGEGEHGEYSRNGDVYKTTVEKGFHFTKPFTGSDFVVVATEQKIENAKGATLDGKPAYVVAKATYKIPSTFTMEDYSRVNHVFANELGLALNETIGQISTRDMKNQAIFSADAQKLCDAFAKGIQNTGYGNRTFKPQDIECIVTAGTYKAVVQSKKL